MSTDLKLQAVNVVRLCVQDLQVSKHVLSIGFVCLLVVAQNPMSQECRYP